MATTTTGLFSTNPGELTDFSGRRPAEIFNEGVIPTVNSFLDLLGEDPGGLEEASQRRSQELNRRTEEGLFATRQDDNFLSQMRQAPAPQQDLGEYAVGGVADYDTPVGRSTTPASTEPLGAQVRGAPVAKNLTDFVKHFEGYNPKAYGDFKQTSIGYGTRARKGETLISKEEAERRLAEELGKARSEVESLNRRHGYNFKENELDALTSFAYNVGSLDQLTANGKRDKDAIARKILEYNKAGGKVLKGLVNRRKAEHNLFTKGY